MNFQGVVFPVERPRVTLRFGAIEYPYSPGDPHLGLDVAPHAGSTGAPVVAAVAGKVIEAGFDDGLGNHAVIESSLPFDVWATDLGGVVHTIGAGEHFWLLYGHLRELFVNDGEHVRTGQQIGELGSSGYAFGPHLHLEMRINNYAARQVVNPLDMLVATVVGLRDEVDYA